MRREGCGSRRTLFHLDTYPTQSGAARVPRVGECADERYAGRYSSEIRTGCANQRSSGSVGGQPAMAVPTRDRQLIAIHGSARSPGVQRASRHAPPQQVGGDRTEPIQTSHVRKTMSLLWSTHRAATMRAMAILRQSRGLFSPSFGPMFALSAYPALGLSASPHSFRTQGRTCPKKGRSEHGTNVVRAAHQQVGYGHEADGYAPRKEVYAIRGIPFPYFAKQPERGRKHKWIPQGARNEPCKVPDRKEGAIRYENSDKTFLSFDLVCQSISFVHLQWPRPFCDCALQMSIVAIRP